MPAKQLAPIDADAKIPAAVKAASARSEAAHKTQYPDAAAPPAPPAPAAAAPPAEPPPAPAPAPTPPPADTWEHKFKSELGRVNTLKAQLQHSNDRLAGLEATIAAMAAAPAAPPAEPTTKSLITEKDVADYGPEFVDLIRRGAEERFAPLVDELRGQVKTLEQKFGSVQSSSFETQRAAMNQALTQALPNWLEINQDQNFLDWLALPDTYSGAIRHTLLKAAYDANATPRVLAFFKGFLAEEAATSPRDPAPDPAPPAPAAEPRVSLESLAAPGRAKSAAAQPAPSEKPIITRAEVTKFYLDKSRGGYAGREAECQRLEQEIILAGRDGRIR